MFTTIFLNILHCHFCTYTTSQYFKLGWHRNKFHLLIYLTRSALNTLMHFCFTAAFDRNISSTRLGFGWSAPQLPAWRGFGTVWHLRQSIYPYLYGYRGTCFIVRCRRTSNRCWYGQPAYTLLSSETFPYFRIPRKAQKHFGLKKVDCT